MVQWIHWNCECGRENSCCCYYHGKNDESVLGNDVKNVMNEMNELDYDVYEMTMFDVMVWRNVCDDETSWLASFHDVSNVCELDGLELQPESSMLPLRHQDLNRT